LEIQAADLLVYEYAKEFARQELYSWHPLRPSASGLLGYPAARPEHYSDYSAARLQHLIAAARADPEGLLT
jgi:hypothetical protein